MLGDLLTTSQERDTIITVEDKDPSILWQMRTDNIIKFWRNTLEKAKDRWQVIETPTTSIVTMYHKLLNKIVPRNLMPSSNSFGTRNLPYAYFTVKHKCFKACFQRKAGDDIPPDPATIPDEPHHHVHMAHTCCKEGR